MTSCRERVSGHHVEDSAGLALLSSPTLRLHWMNVNLSIFRSQYELAIDKGDLQYSLLLGISCPNRRLY